MSKLINGCKESSASSTAEFILLQIKFVICYKFEA